MMNPIQKSLLSLLILTGFSASAQFTDVINSNRPGESMSAFSVGKTVIQTEIGLQGYKQEHVLLETEAQGWDAEAIVRYGAFFEQLELIGEINYGSESGSGVYIPDYDRSGLKSFTVGAKYLIYDPYKKYFDRKPNLLSWKANNGFKWRDLIPAIGVYAGANLRISDKFPPLQEQRLTAKVMGITQNQLGRFVLVTNWMMERLGSNNEMMGYIVTLTYGINPRWSAFAENQGFKSDYYGDLIFRGGAAYLLAENMQLDLSVGTGIKNTPSVLNAGIGFSWRFDANYEDVLVRLPKEEKKGDKKDKKKKKRKDEVVPESAPAAE